MDEHMKEILAKNMTDNLPTLRTKLGVSQEKIAEMVGVSRSTIACIENHKRPMPWNLFLSLLMIFTKNKETDRLLNVMEIYTDELNDYVKNRVGEGEACPENAQTAFR